MKPICYFTDTPQTRELASRFGDYEMNGLDREMQVLLTALLALRAYRLLTRSNALARKPCEEVEEALEILDGLDVADVAGVIGFLVQ